MSTVVDYYALGTRIRAAREKKHLTQEQLGEICSLSAAHIGHVERGTRTPSLDAIVSIAQALNVSMDSLLLDTFDSDEAFVHLSAILKDKNREKVRRFVVMVTAMAEKIDDM